VWLKEWPNEYQIKFAICKSKNIIVEKYDENIYYILTGKKYKKLIGSVTISSMVKSVKDPDNNFIWSLCGISSNNKLS
jgi:hypothetical protein